MATGIAQKTAQLYFHCGPLGKMIYQKVKKIYIYIYVYIYIKGKDRKH